MKTTLLSKTAFSFSALFILLGFNPQAQLPVQAATVGGGGVGDLASAR